MAKSRSLVYSIIFDGAKAAAGARKISQESKGLSKSLAGVKTSSLEVREALHRLERATASQQRVMANKNRTMRQVEGANLRVERAERNLAKAQDATNRSTHRLSGSLKTAAKYAAGAAAAYVSISQVKDAVTTTEELGKTTLTLSKNFGLSVKTASELAAVMRARGVDANKLTMGFKTLSTQVYQASHGSKQAAEMFKALGISQQDLQKNGRNTDWVLRAVSDGLGKMGAGTDKAALASKLFGRSWKDLAPIIRSGSREMQAQLDMAEKYGVTFNGKTIKSVRELAAAQREQKLAIMGIQLALGQALIPVITKALKAFNGFVLGFRKGTGAGGKFREQLEKLKGPAQDIAKFIGGAARGIGRFVSENPKLVTTAAKFAIIGAATSKILKLTGTGGLIKLGFGRGNTPLTPMFVKEVAPGGVRPKTSPIGKTPPIVTGIKNVAKFGGPVGLSAALTYQQILQYQRGLPGSIEDRPGPRTSGLPTTQQNRLPKGDLGKLLPIKTPKLDTRDTLASAKTLNASIKRTWDRLKGDTSTSLEDIQKNVARNTRRIKRSMDTDTEAGGKALRSNFHNAISAVKEQMRRGVVSVQDGTQEIRRILAQALITFGIRNVKLGTNDVAGRLFAAGGGWIGSPGQAGRDTVPAMLGVGEAVLNRHQQVPVEAALRATYGMGLDDLFAQVRRPHYLAEGGRIKNQKMRGGLGVITTLGQRALDREDRAAERYLAKLIGSSDLPAGTPGSMRGAAALAQELGLTVTSTTGGRHAKNSWHYKGRAIDVAGSGSAMARFFRAAYRRYGSHLLELFYDPIGFYVKNGARVNGAIGGHGDHVHIAMANGGWVKTGATRFDDPPPGAGNLGKSGYHFAELGTATKSGRGTGRGYLARLFGMSGELPMGTKLQVRRGGKTITADKQDRGYGQGSSAYAIDLWRGAADALGVSKGQVEVRLLSGGKAQSTTSELDKKHAKLDKRWRAEMRKAKPRSAELLKIANEGLKLTEGEKSKRGKQLRALWRDRHSYALRARSRRRRANEAAARLTHTEQQRETNAGRLKSIFEDPLEGNYLAATLTPDKKDDLTTAQAGLDYWTGRVNMAQAAWNQGLLTDPGVLSEAIGQRETWQGRVDEAKKPPPDNSDVLAEIRDLMRAADERARYIGNTADGALARAVTAVVSGQIGGRVGLGFATPSYAGAYARY